MDAEVPADPEEGDALPEGWLDELAPGLLLLVGRLPEPLDVDDEDEEGEEDGDDGLDELEPPDEGMPPEELLDEDDVAQPAVTTSRPTAAAVAARCSLAATTVVTRSMGPAPSGTSVSRLLRSSRLSQPVHCACRSSVNR